ncbi:hypothetical protein L6164_027773 [Bauhinia variegata]|uniref:Uncharacterized protein n=1 Tax=Bauhinia variegata TaxID=167791 RepID=A0ACB9LU83_BAUVA|nr:hypothetical protein L6164_027773 [Bauhinia variegata]
MRVFVLDGKQWLVCTLNHGLTPKIGSRLAESYMSDREDNDSDAPEGIQQDEEVRKILRESNAGCIRDRNSARVKWVLDFFQTTSFKCLQLVISKFSNETLMMRKPNLEPVILSGVGPPQCLRSSLEFLKKKKMGVSRSSAVLNNSNQALRLLSGSSVISRR